MASRSRAEVGKGSQVATGGAPVRADEHLGAHGFAQATKPGFQSWLRDPDRPRVRAGDAVDDHARLHGGVAKGAGMSHRNIVLLSHGRSSGIRGHAHLEAGARDDSRILSAEPGQVHDGAGHGIEPGGSGSTSPGWTRCPPARPGSAQREGAAVRPPLSFAAPPIAIRAAGPRPRDESAVTRHGSLARA